MEMMKVDPELVRKLREERAWSQEQLAAVAGLSLRTVQRVESDANASAETRMSLASAFGVELESLKPTGPATAEPPPSSPVQGVPVAASSNQPVPVKKLSYLYYRLLRFLVIVGLLVGFDVYETGSVTWSRWILVFGVALCGLRVIKAQFVDPEELRRRRSVSRNV
ncbi:MULTISPECIES: helix-turn-helix domain-containing protein [unclassified Variovorax]|jgi:transcriptional regulator with XRE-family HTH domain|uniref:helix-turn-helix domain-containing protein n=1 Tax=unclassified Variovorax TaxID=663243 RepID=UPI002B23ECFE|nr:MULTISPECIES: helix-turn-helix domain-containing protein [unclassified Variovorax]MEB0060330.1 helix-turn-helix domain-containing protein [Variovorax sp. LG9.2]MEB0111702.1 helix-turn-helix domain-containing protein [Variovorax sp. RTB1]